MKNNVLTVAILGCGNRGAYTYGALMAKKPDKYKIVALCDKSQARLQQWGDCFDVSKSARFLDCDTFFEKKRADVLVIATQDDTHVAFCLRALEVGYDILLEKPLTDKKDECFALLDAQKKYGGRVVVCHVLRYGKFFVMAKELLDKGAIGRLVSIQATEQVGYWHTAHSYVRGNWRNTADSAPMILAKCCHDLDLLQYYAGDACKMLSSVGNLAYFKPENAPDNATKRCLDCPLVDTCAYSAKRIYIDVWHSQGCPEGCWPFGAITNTYPLTENALMDALRQGPYGRCVFHCDNNVVDHQLTQMTFENGVKASLAMMGFTHGGGRIYKFYGTEGEMILKDDSIELKPFGKEPLLFDGQDNLEGGHAHGGGDNGLIDSLYEMMTDEVSRATSLANSIESHLMGICAEESRLANGKTVFVHENK